MQISINIIFYFFIFISQLTNSLNSIEDDNNPKSVTSPSVNVELETKLNDL